MSNVKRVTTGIFGMCLLIGTELMPAHAQTAQTWDGLVQVEGARMGAVFLDPDADFSGYTKVIFDTPEVAFRKNYQRDINRGSLGLTNRLSNADARRMLDYARDSLLEIFGETFEAEGYEVVAAPGEDVLRISMAIIDLDVAAPSSPATGTQSYVQEAGRATLALEARDSETGDLLGRVVDRRSTGRDPGGFYISSTTTNAVEFRRLFSSWASTSVTGLNELKAAALVDDTGARNAN